ncbi:MAG: hypothetical protein UX75_C0036G0018 [Candidatus Moranbacteria bacterium GW2011_GWE2_47_10]|nr:MAG: hypothetical protein UX75_C0036G0018 [Candidatus Moranbacteria bacterium GW2011_GWE2_47_10]
MSDLSNHKWDTSQYTAIKNKHILVEPARYDRYLQLETENIDLREQLLFADQRIKLLELQMQLKTNCKPA